MLLNARMMKHVLLALTFGKVWVLPLSVDVLANVIPGIVTTQLLTQLQNKWSMPADELGPKVCWPPEDSAHNLHSKLLQHRHSMLGPAISHDTLHISKRPQAKAVHCT